MAFGVGRDALFCEDRRINYDPPPLQQRVKGAAR
jgi:hypothetical protein